MVRTSIKISADVAFILRQTRANNKEMAYSSAPPGEDTQRLALLFPCETGLRGKKLTTSRTSPRFGQASRTTPRAWDIAERLCVVKSAMSTPGGFVEAPQAHMVRNLRSVRTIGLLSLKIRLK